MRTRTCESVILEDRIKIGRILYPDIKDLTKLVDMVSIKFQLENVSTRINRIINKGPSFKSPCTAMGCDGRMVPRALTEEEAKTGAKFKLVCETCKHEILSNQEQNIWIDKGAGITIKEAETMTRPVPPFRKKVLEFLKVSTGYKVIEEIYQERLKMCGYKQSVKCEYLKENNGKIWCSSCGCGYREDAELTKKLRFAGVSCPKLKGGFPAISEKTHKHLLIMESLSKRLKNFVVSQSKVKLISK